MDVTFAQPDLEINFAQLAAIWMQELVARKRKPISPTTQRTFSSYIRRLTPLIGASDWPTSTMAP
jgi:hypothetical protein